jgi:hypothetical protein
MFAANGDFIKTWWSPGEAHGQLNKPHSMTYDSQGDVYVTDMNNHRIQCTSICGGHYCTK